MGYYIDRPQDAADRIVGREPQRDIEKGGEGSGVRGHITDHEGKDISDRGSKASHVGHVSQVLNNGNKVIARDDKHNGYGGTKAVFHTYEKDKGGWNHMQSREGKNLDGPKTGGTGRVKDPALTSRLDEASK